jgi:hypothetical protein
MLQFINLFTPRKIPVIGYGGLYYEGDRRASGMKGGTLDNVREELKNNTNESMVKNLTEIEALYDTYPDFHNIFDTYTKSENLQTLKTNRGIISSMKKYIRSKKNAIQYLNEKAVEEARAIGDEIAEIEGEYDIDQALIKKSKESLDISTKTFWLNYKIDNDARLKKIKLSFEQIKLYIDYFYKDRELNPVLDTGKLEYNDRGVVFEVFFNYCFQSFRNYIDIKYTNTFNTKVSSYIKNINDDQRQYYPLDNIMVTKMTTTIKSYAMCELKMYSFLKEENTPDNYFLQVTKFCGYSNITSRMIPLYIKEGKYIKLYNIINVQKYDKEITKKKIKVIEKVIEARYTLPEQEYGYPIYVIVGLKEGIYKYVLTDDEDINIKDINTNYNTFKKQYSLDIIINKNKDLFKNIPMEKLFFIDNDDLYVNQIMNKDEKGLNKRIKINPQKLIKIIS